MPLLSVRKLAAVAALSVVVPFANTAHAQQWGQYGVKVYALPENFSFGTWAFGLPPSVNNFGQVAGTFNVGNTSTAALLNVRTGTSVNDIFNSPLSSVGGINNLGQVVGSVFTGIVQGPGGGHFTSSAMFYDGSTSIALPAFSFDNGGRAINDHGLIVGESFGRAVAWSGGSVKEFGALLDPAAPHVELTSQVVALNNAGVAVGHAANYDTGVTYAATFDASGAHFLDPSLAGSSAANAINNAGVIVGTIVTDAGADFSAFYHDATGTHLLPKQGLLLSNGWEIDDTGRIFGLGVWPDFSGGVTLWEHAGGGYAMYFLDAILDAHTAESNWQTGQLSVSDNGEFIAAYACHGDDRSTCGSFVFQSITPEPSTILLLGSGLLLVIGAVRRRSLERVMN